MHWTVGALTLQSVVIGFATVLPFKPMALMVTERDLRRLREALRCERQETKCREEHSHRGIAARTEHVAIGVSLPSRSEAADDELGIQRVVWGNDGEERRRISRWERAQGGGIEEMVRRGDSDKVP